MPVFFPGARSFFYHVPRIDQRMLIQASNLEIGSISIWPDLRLRMERRSSAILHSSITGVCCVHYGLLLFQINIVVRVPSSFLFFLFTHNRSTITRCNSTSTSQIAIVRHQGKEFCGELLFLDHHVGVLSRLCRVQDMDHTPLGDPSDHWFHRRTEPHFHCQPEFTIFVSHHNQLPIEHSGEEQANHALFRWTLSDESVRRLTPVGNEGLPACPTSLSSQACLSCQPCLSLHPK